MNSIKGEISDQSSDMKKTNLDFEIDDVPHNFDISIKEEPVDTFLNDETVLYDIKSEIYNQSSNIKIKFETNDDSLDFESFAEHSVKVDHLNIKQEEILADADRDRCQTEQEIISQKVLENALKINSDKNFLQKIQDSKFPIVLVKQLTFKSKVKRNLKSLDNILDGSLLEKKCEQNSCNRRCDSSQRKVDRWLCPKCQYRAPSHWKLKRHLQTHSSIKLLKCSYCNYECNRKESLNNHVSTHLKENRFKCHCGYETKNKLSLKRHVLNHSDKRFQCPTCEYQNNSRHFFFLHLIRHQDLDLLTEFSIGFNSSLLKCFLCRFEAPSKIELSSHLTRHIKMKWMSCTECDYKTIDRSSLKRHLLSHASSKLLNCSECKYETNDYSHLKRHRLRHLKEPM